MELLGRGPIIDRLHLAHINEAEGLRIPDAEQQFYVMDPADARMRKRDELASDAALLFSQFFSRMSDEKDREMLRDCFVETQESRKADFELEKIVQRVMNNITALNTGEGGALQEQIERTIRAKRSETVLIVGNKGSGKSTFIDRFFEQVLPLSMREECVVARVDLESYHGDPRMIVGWAIDQLRTVLEKKICSHDPPSYDDLMGVFFSEYKRLSEGSQRHLYLKDKEAFKIFFGNHMEERRERHPDEYVRRLLERACYGLEKLPCLIFDNTDQFAPGIQDMVYQLAHSYESAGVVFNVVPITDRTVWRLSKDGALQSLALSPAIEGPQMAPSQGAGSHLHNPCKAAWLLARKQQLLERLQEDPGPQERDEIGRLFVQIDAALDLVDEAGPDTTAREAIRNADQ